MADLGKKISELQETTDLAGLYTIGTDKNTQSKKVSLQFLKEAADYANSQGDYAKEVGDTVAGNVGVNAYPTFSASTQYAAGSVVNYNGKLYRFTSLHPAGAWVGTDAVLTSIKAEADLKLTELESEVGQIPVVIYAKDCPFIKEIYITEEGRNVDLKTVHIAYVTEEIKNISFSNSAQDTFVAQTYTLADTNILVLRSRTNPTSETILGYAIVDFSMVAHAVPILQPLTDAAYNLDFSPSIKEYLSSQSLALRISDNTSKLGTLQNEVSAFPKELQALRQSVDAAFSDIPHITYVSDCPFIKEIYITEEGRNADLKTVHMVYNLSYNQSITFSNSSQDAYVAITSALDNTNIMRLLDYREQKGAILGYVVVDWNNAPSQSVILQPLTDAAYNLDFSPSIKEYLSSQDLALRISDNTSKILSCEHDVSQLGERCTELEKASEDSITEMQAFKEAVITQVDKYKPINIEGNVVNAADEEDITSNNGLLKLKDRSALNGMGYIILRKGEALETQLTNGNTIYEIRYDFDLGGATITLPYNCVLKFNGGSFSNGTLKGNNTLMSGYIHKLPTNNIVLSGSFLKNDFILPKGEDVSDILQYLLDTFNYASLKEGTYYIRKPIILNHSNTIIKGAGRHNTVIRATTQMDYMFKTLRKTGDDKGVYYDVSFNTFQQMFLDGNNLAKIGIYNIGPSCIFNELYITRCQNIGLKSFGWCCSFNKCIITYASVGLNIELGHNNVVFENRIEANSVYDIYISESSAAVIDSNVLESECKANVYAVGNFGLRISNNYFEGTERILESEISSSHNIEGLNEINARIIIAGAHSSYDDNIMLSMGDALMNNSITVINNHDEGKLAGTAMVLATAVNGLNIEGNSSKATVDAMHLIYSEQTKISNVVVRDNVLANGEMPYYKVLVSNSQYYYNHPINLSDNLVFGRELSENALSNVALLGTAPNAISHSNNIFKSFSKDYVEVAMLESGTSDRTLGVSALHLKGIFCIEFTAKSEESVNPLHLSITNYLSGQKVSSLSKDIICSAEGQHYKIYGYAHEGLADEISIVFTSPAENEVYHILNPMIYMVAGLRPAMNYKISSVIPQDTNIEGYYTKMIPVGVIGETPDGKRYICTEHSQDNGFDKWTELSFAETDELEYLVVVSKGRINKISKEQFKAWLNS